MLWHSTLIITSASARSYLKNEKVKKCSSQNYIQIPFILNQVCEIRNGSEVALTWPQLYKYVVQVREQTRTGWKRRDF
jgi:hypothetical protein